MKFTFRVPYNERQYTRTSGYITGTVEADSEEEARNRISDDCYAGYENFNGLQFEYDEYGHDVYDSDGTNLEMEELEIEPEVEEDEPDK